LVERKVGGGALWEEAEEDTLKPPLPLALPELVEEEEEEEEEE